MRKVIIHVARAAIQRNARDGTDEPAIIVRRGAKSSRHHTVEILGPSRFVSSPNKPLPCGARLWVEVDPSIELRAT